MPLELPDPYAGASDLATYWGRALSTAEQGRAETLLRWAAHGIKRLPGADGFDPLVCARVSMDMVKRAMQSKIDGASEIAQSMQDMSSTIRYVNPAGNLYMTSREIAELTGPTSPAFSLTPMSNARVPGDLWNHQSSSQTDAGT